MSLINRLLVDLDKRQVRITDQTDLPPLEIKAFHVVPKNGHRFSRPVWLGIFSLVAILATS
ncbi:MAG TPA: hypothetical protein HPQ00_07220, partial [Magnetococcales bacterium]|nr:hypothetical protein [Magnetococcales bacterium]